MWYVILYYQVHGEFGCKNCFEGINACGNPEMTIYWKFLFQSKVTC